MKYEIDPVSKPRQTRSDRWKQRPAVVRYRAFADECRLRGVVVPESGAHIVFNMPMPPSWSKRCTNVVTPFFSATSRPAATWPNQSSRL